MNAVAAASLALLVSLFSAAPCVTNAAERSAAGAEQVSNAALIAEHPAVQPGRPFTVAIRLNPAPGWHTYWRNPGDSGMAAEIAWHLPRGFTAGPILWPAPQRFNSGPITSYGYAGEVWLLTDITPPPALVPGGTVSIAADVDWLVCREICIPERASLTLPLGVAAEQAGSELALAADAVRTEAFERARMALPVASSWAARYRLDGDRLRLIVNATADLKGEAADFWFYPYDGLSISHGAPQRARLEMGVLTIDMIAAAGGAPPPVPLAGVLVFNIQERAHAIEIKANREQSG